MKGFFFSLLAERRNLFTSCSTSVRRHYRPSEGQNYRRVTYYQAITREGGMEGEKQRQQQRSDDAAGQR